MNIELGQLAGGFLKRRGHRETFGPISKQQLRLQLYIALMAIDVLAIVLGFVIGDLIRFNQTLTGASINMIAVVVPIYLGIALNSRSYGIEVLRQRGLGARRATMSLLFTVTAVTFIAFYMKASADFSRIVFGCGAIASFFLIVVGRRGLSYLTTHLVGTSPLCEILIDDGGSIVSMPGAFVVHAGTAGLRPDIRDPWMLDRLGHVVKNADRVVVACRAEDRWSWAMALKGANIRGEVVTPEMDQLGALATDRAGHNTTLVVSTGPLGLRDRAMKRLLDLVLGVIAIIALAPVMLVAAIAVRMEDGGPILFTQQRLGRGNRLFMMHKFRSMHLSHCDGQGKRSTERGDSRLTKVGRFIRATSIDELPQLFNILKGDMSFVGPRPHALGSTAGDKLFWEVDQRYWHRHASKPGLTGLAQVRGFRGATRSRTDLTSRLQADLEYLSDWTIWRDISILFSTFKVVIHKNAF